MQKMLGATLGANAYLDRLRQGIDLIDHESLRLWSDTIYQAWQQERFVFLCGNGGSACNATHMAQDFGKSTLRESDLTNATPRRLKVLSLTDNVGWMLAVGNDCGYDQIFVQQLMNYAGPGDVLIGISGSGNSANVLEAVDWSNRNQLTTIGLTGYDGGSLREQVTQSIHIDCEDMGLVESLHLATFHWVLDDLFARINQVGRYANSS